MGTWVSAECACGFTAEASVGGGKRNFTRVCEFPCLCAACDSMVSVNLLAAQPKCPTCKSMALTPYDAHTLSDHSSELIVADWDMRSQLGRCLKLTKSNYICPKCTKPRLSFGVAGLFD